MRDLQDVSRYHGASSIGSYRLIRSLGAGPLSRTYLAEHEAIPKQQFALKIMEAVPLHSAKMQEQAFLEVHRLQDLRHAHVLPILEVWMHERVLCLVTPYATAGSLRQRLAMSPGSPLPLDTSLAILRQIGEALHSAHQQQMVHANLKPENVLLQPDDDSFLADFYLPALMQSEQAVRIRQALGASYMAPEQLLHGKTTPLSDQYSLACLAFELLTGRAPFQADDFEGIARKHLLEMPAFPARSARARNEPVPLVESVILKALSKRPEERYPDVWEFITALRVPSPLFLGSETNIPPTLVLPERSTQRHADVPTYLAGPGPQLEEGQQAGLLSMLPQGTLLPIQTLALPWSAPKRRRTLIGLLSLASCVILPFLLAFLMAFSPAYRTTIRLPVSPAGTVFSNTAVTAPQGAQSGATPPFQPPQSAGAPGASPFPSATPKPTTTIPVPSPTPLPTATAPAPSPTPLPSPTTPPPPPPPTPTPPPPPPTPTPPPPAQICAVNYTVNTQWPGGFVVTITITNTSPGLINGWTLAFTFRGDQSITNGWNGVFNQNGEAVRIGNAPYNMQIQAGATITLGFQGTWQMSNASPTRFSLDGAVCS